MEIDHNRATRAFYAEIKRKSIETEQFGPIRNAGITMVCGQRASGKQVSVFKVGKRF